MVTSKQHSEAYAVVRIDLPFNASTPGDSVTVKQVVTTRELAEAEVVRLSQLNDDQGCVYLATPTRVFPAGRSAGARND